jgi:hypothetical protein
MLKFEYEIKLNDDGRPYIDISPDHDDNIEDKFMGMELTRYILTGIYNIRKDVYTENDLKVMKLTLEFLEKVSDEMALILKGAMETSGELQLTYYRDFDIQVPNIKKRDDINYEGIIYGNKLFKRCTGLKVMVQDTMKVYQLVDGIDNEHWKEVNK